MKPSGKVLSSGPVVTFFSGSTGAARRCHQVLRSLFDLENVSVLKNEEDELNRISFPSLLSSVAHRSGGGGWESLALQCASSGAILHFIAPSFSAGDWRNNNDKSLSLLAVTGGADKDASGGVVEARECLADYFRDTLVAQNGTRWSLLAFKLGMRRAMGGSLHASHFMERDGGLPLLRLPGDNSRTENHTLSNGDPRNGRRNHSSRSHSEGGGSHKFRLREVVIPHFDEATYANGQNLWQRCSGSGMSRPAVGLYKWPLPHALSIRPIPAASEDMALSPPSLVFQCVSLEEAHCSLLEAADDLQIAKIGFTGTNTGVGQNSQLLVHHSAWMGDATGSGIHIRLCQSSVPCSAFAEAQESLMAGSLADLQNVNVMVEGQQQETQLDSRNLQGDCWVEVRANLKNPSGYFARGRSMGRRRDAAAGVGSFWSADLQRKGGNQTLKKQGDRYARAPNLPFD